MEPTNRPYVAPEMEPGDTGTEPWADGDATGDRGPLADPATTEQTEPALEDSPADGFITGDVAPVGTREDDDTASG